ncbi:MAG: choice-of-anchor J domain-containing protein [Spirochaetia bacterium]|jgi:hypothetical protein|nr:choice-of-anchor J domain-containing protein [Spirochaetia bacterium]
MSIFRKRISILLLTLFTLTTMHIFGETDQYRLVWTDDPATTMTIGWTQSGGSDSHVEGGLKADGSDWQRIEVDFKTTFDNTLHAEGSLLTNNFVKAKGLEPDTAYYFAVKDSDGSSETMWFKTAPDSPQPFVFIAGGDSRTNQEPRRHGNTLVSKIRPLFVYFGGDYIADCSNDQWRMWLDDWQLTKSSDGRMYPIIPTHGNHEDDVIEMMYQIFGLKDADGNKNAYYALNIGGDMMRLYTLNTELEPGVGYGVFTDQDDTAWNMQTAWLASDLVKNKDSVNWLLASYHRPFRPHIRDKSEGPGRIDAWADLFYENGMDLVSESDTHLVKYTYPLKPSFNPDSFESFIRDDGNGTVFIGEGSWGAPHRANNDNKPWTAASNSFWQFKVIQATEEKLDIRTVKFGSIKAQASGNSYDPSTVTELTQAEKDAAPLALPEGLVYWQSIAGEVFSLPFKAATDNIQYVGSRSDWKYLDGGVDPEEEWAISSFNDSSWATGAAQLGYGDGDEVVELSFGDDSANKDISYYFRKTFDVTDASSLIKLKLLFLRDDGGVVYINGKEAARSNMPEGVIGDSTMATSGIGGAAETTFYEYQLDPSLLKNGENIVAVEVHQSDLTSSDVSFDMVLYGIVSNETGDIPAVPSNLAGSALSPYDIELSWTDNGTNEVGYELWRKVGDGEFSIFNTQIDPDTETLADILLAVNQEYTYMVRAYNQYGLSDFSETVTITTQSIDVPLVMGEDFSSETLGIMNQVSVASNVDWGIEKNGAKTYAMMNGYHADEASDDWLIAPAINLFAHEREYINADLAYNYDGPDLEVLFSTNYNPDKHADPASANWFNMNADLPSIGSYTFENTGNLEFNLVSEDFESNTTGSFTAFSKASDKDWTIEKRADYLGAVSNGYGADEASDDWLISPVIQLDKGMDAELAFDLYRKYDGPQLEVMVSTNYSGSGDPIEASWDSYSIDHSDIDDSWKTINIDLSKYSGNTYIAFRYTTTGTGGGDGARLGVDNISVYPNSKEVYVAFHYISGTESGEAGKWIVDNFEFRAYPYAFFSEEFEADIADESGFLVYSAASNKDWTVEERADQKGVFMNGYGADKASEDWLISPELTITEQDNAALVFDLYRKYDGPALEVMFSNNYSGKGDPNKADWVSYPVDHSDLDDSWKTVAFDLSAYSGTGYAAFRYTSAGVAPGDGGRLGLDNVAVIRSADAGVIDADLTIRIEAPESVGDQTVQNGAAVLPDSIKKTGDWEVTANGLIQDDASQYFAKYVIDAPQNETNLVYTFSGKASTEGWKGFGVHILASGSKTAQGYGYGQSYLIWVTKDPENTNSNSTFVQLYKSFSDSRMEQLVSKAIDRDISETVNVQVLVNHDLNTIVVIANGKPVIRFTDKNLIQSGNEIVIRALDKAVFTDGGVFPLSK